MFVMSRTLMLLVLLPWAGDLPSEDGLQFPCKSVASKVLHHSFHLGSDSYLKHAKDIQRCESPFGAITAEKQTCVPTIYRLTKNSVIR
jgi:hypothetical protein